MIIMKFLIITQLNTNIFILSCQQQILKKHLLRIYFKGENYNLTLEKIITLILQNHGHSVNCSYILERTIQPF